MTGASTHSPDRTSVTPSSADVRVTTASNALPQSEGAVVTPNSVVAASLRDAPAPVGVSSLDLPAASSGVAGLSDCISDVDPVLEAEIQRLEVQWLRAGIVMNAATLATIAASESFSNSTSSVGA